MRTHEFQLDESERELVQKVRDFEMKIFESLIHSRDMLMTHDYYSGESVPIIPSQYDYLIILSQQLQGEFDLLRESELAYQHRGLFGGEVRLTLTRLEDHISNELSQRILTARRNQYPYKQIYDSHTHYLKEVLQYVKEANNKNDIVTAKQKISNGEAKPTYQQYALYYYYMQKAGLIEQFENWPDGIVPAYQEVCKKHGLTAKTSWRRFQREYTGLKNDSDRKKLCKRNYNTLIELLKDNPAAITAAQEELKAKHS